MVREYAHNNSNTKMTSSKCLKFNHKYIKQQQQKKKIQQFPPLTTCPRCNEETYLLMLERKCVVLVKERMKQKSSARNPTLFGSKRKYLEKFHRLSTHPPTTRNIKYLKSSIRWHRHICMNGK